MSVQLNLPPGFRFHPTDDELVEHYLCRKCSGLPVPVPIVAEIDLYKFDPWQLPGVAVYGEKEWYFFSPRDRKYPNGSRPNRAAGTGYWKATGADKPIGRQRTLGIKKALVFYTGKAPTGVKTNWIMHEYRLANVDRSAGKNKQLRLDDWVLCRIYNKKGSISWNEQCQRTQAAVKSEHPPESLPPVMADTFRVEDSGSPPWAATESSASDSLVSERPVQSSGRQYELSRAAGPQSYYIACNEFGDYPPQASLCSLPDMIMSMHNPWSFT